MADCGKLIIISANFKKEQNIEINLVNQAVAEAEDPNNSSRYSLRGSQLRHEGSGLTNSKGVSSALLRMRSLSREIKD